MTNRQARMLGSALIVLAGAVILAAGVMQSPQVSDEAEATGALVALAGGVAFVVEWFRSLMEDGAASRAAKSPDEES